MAAYRVLKTSFPPVLSQYLPEQASADDGRPDNVEDGDGEDEEDQAETDGKPRTAKSVRVAPGTNGGDPNKEENPGSRRKPPATTRKHPAPPPRQNTAVSLSNVSVGRRSDLRKREAEAERLEHVADVWDQARSEVLNERHSQLQEKVQLQHQLLKAQDQQALHIRQRREQLEVLKRQKEKQLKQKKEAELQGVCKQSLNADRKKGRELGGLSKRSTALNTPTIPSSPSSAHSSGDGFDQSHNSSSSSSSSSSNSNSSSGAGNTRAADRPSRQHPGYFPSKALPEHQLSSSPMRELENEEEEETAGMSGSKGEGGIPAGVPSHHAQLYQLYGKQADYFLHPKPAQPAQASRKPTHPKIKSQKGHIGAGELWDTLRKDSMNKLVRNDHRFPLELKSAFSAFVRERLTKHSRPVERSFCATEDVPDIKRLMDQSKLRRTRLYRHKTELMYRSSVNNMDRTSILLHNSPLPDITETGQADSISRYLPSWIDDESDVSEEEYMKWIRDRQQEQLQLEDGSENKENVRHSAHSRQLSETTNELQNIWLSIAGRNKKPRTPRYQFLTEKAAESEGLFSQKFHEEKEQREKPQPHHVAKSYSALEFSHPSSSFSVPPSRERGQSAMQLQRYRSDWQPLSMAALEEYKKRLDTEGTGDFEHGRMKMWPAATSTIA